jgi:hypothetical protein
LTPFETDGAHSFCGIDPRFHLSLFHGRARTRDIEALYATLRRHFAQSSGSVALLTVIGAGSTLGEHGRKLIAEMMKELDPRVEAWGITIEGQGLWATTARAMTATTRLFSRTKHPFKVTSTAKDALIWMEQRCARPMPEGTLATLEVMREKLAQIR